MFVARVDSEETICYAVDQIEIPHSEKIYGRMPMRSGVTRREVCVELLLYHLSLYP